MTQICVSKLTIIGSDNGLSLGRCQAIIWTNAGILLIGPLVTNLGEILLKLYLFSFKKMHLKMSSGNWRPFCLGLNVLTCLGNPQLMSSLSYVIWDRTQMISYTYFHTMNPNRAWFDTFVEDRYVDNAFFRMIISTTLTLHLANIDLGSHVDNYTCMIWNKIRSVVDTGI